MGSVSAQRSRGEGGAVNLPLWVNGSISPLTLDKALIFRTRVTTLDRTIRKNLALFSLRFSLWMSHLLSGATTEIAWRSDFAASLTVLGGDVRSLQSTRKIDAEAARTIGKSTIGTSQGRVIRRSGLPTASSTALMVAPLRTDLRRAGVPDLRASWSLFVAGTTAMRRYLNVGPTQKDVTKGGVR
jgi:hypothetical protein